MKCSVFECSGQNYKSGGNENLLATPSNYFLVDFKEISSIILAKNGVGTIASYPLWPRHWLSEVASCTYWKIELKIK